MLVSRLGKADTVRMLVSHGASVESVDKVTNIHAHALANTSCITDVSVIMRLTRALSLFPALSVSLSPSLSLSLDIYTYIYIYAYVYI